MASKKLLEAPPPAYSSTEDEPPSSEDEEEIDPVEDEEERSEDQEYEEDDDDEEGKSESPVRKSTGTASTAAQSGWDDDSGSESGSDSDPTPRSPDASAFTVKPIAPTPIPKRPAESDPYAKDPKKTKVMNGDNGQVKKGTGNHRLWSEDDEITILKGMSEYQYKKGSDPNAYMGAFYEFIKKSLHVDVSKSQLMDKIRRLKKKFQVNCERGKNGEVVFKMKPHEHRSFQLSKKIWGCEEKSKKIVRAKEEEEEEEEDDDDEEEEKSKSSRRRPGSEDESGYESEPDSYQTQPSRTAFAFTMKPSKRLVESDLNAKDSKKRKARNGDDEDAKKGIGNQRLWSEDDEIAILKGITEYQSDKGYADTSAFHEFIKKSLRVEVSKNQLIEKIRRLKKKFQLNAVKGENSEDPVFSKPHEQQSFELSKKIWGCSESNGRSVRQSGKSNNKKNPKQEESVIMKGTVNGETGKKDEFWEKYPYLSESLMVVAELRGALVRERVRKIGEAEAKDLDEKWRKLQMMELGLSMRRAELVAEQGKLILDAMKD